MSAEEQDRPPFFKTWRGAYLFVLASLAVTVVALSLLARTWP